MAIVATANAPEVSYYGQQDPSLILVLSTVLFPIPGLLALGVEGAIRSGVDGREAARVGEHVNLSYVQDKMAQSFIQPLRQAGCFQATEYVTDKSQSARQLSAAGYNAIIKLAVRKISIERSQGNYVRLYAHVHGQMECLASGKVVWDREEVVSSPEPQTLDYYKTNGLKELNAMLKKAGRNLAYDFIYPN